MTETAKASIPASVVLTMVRGLLTFPYPQICRHLVAAELLGALGEAGYAVPSGAVEATWNANDDEALELLS